MNKNTTTQTLTTIRILIESMTIDQLPTLFHVYLHLDFLCDFFMSEESHIAMINQYYDTPSIRHLETFKTFLLYVVTRHTLPSKYCDVLTTIEMINHNYSFEKIIRALYHQHKNHS